jgi:hypothetical protein
MFPRKPMTPPARYNSHLIRTGNNRELLRFNTMEVKKSMQDLFASLFIYIIGTVLTFLFVIDTVPYTVILVLLFIENIYRFFFNFHHSRQFEQYGTLNLHHIISCT